MLLLLSDVMKPGRFSFDRPSAAACSRMNLRTVRAFAQTHGPQAGAGGETPFVYPLKNLLCYILHMIVTSLTKKALECRRFHRQKKLSGWVHVDEPVWEINRGFAIEEKIIDCAISPDGKSVYVKVSGGFRRT